MLILFRLPSVTHTVQHFQLTVSDFKQTKYLLLLHVQSIQTIETHEHRASSIQIIINDETTPTSDVKQRWREIYYVPSKNYTQILFWSWMRGGQSHLQTFTHSKSEKWWELFIVYYCKNELVVKWSLLLGTTRFTLKLKQNEWKWSGRHIIWQNRRKRNETNIK